jgi:hypothetical protein
VSVKSCILALLAVGLLAGSAAQGQREWISYPTALPACGGSAERELNCTLTQCAGYGAAGNWATEIQVHFCMPDAVLGGPWLVEYVTLYMSGSGTHTIVLRNPGAGACAPALAPGDVLQEGWSFTPASPSWPPTGWTTVQLSTEPPYSPYLLCGEGQGLCIGVALKSGDCFGLSSQTGLDGAGWGSYQDNWSYDSQAWSLTPAIRIGMLDLGLSQAESTTWGRMKGLFR